jgi:hypothetical protein
MQGVPSSLGGDKRRCDMQRQLHGTGFVLREQMDRALLSQVSSQLSLPGALRRRCAPSALRRSWAPTLDHCTLFFYVQFHRLPSLRSSFVALDVVTERHTHTDVPNHFWELRVAFLVVRTVACSSQCLVTVALHAPPTVMNDTPRKSSARHGADSGFGFQDFLGGATAVPRCLLIRFF